MSTAEVMPSVEITDRESVSADVLPFPGPQIPPVGAPISEEFDSTLTTESFFSANSALPESQPLLLS